jgi:hypothetical protein
VRNVLSSILTASDFELGVSPLVRRALLSLLMLDLGDVESSVACGVMSESKAYYKYAVCTVQVPIEEVCGRKELFGGRKNQCGITWKKGSGPNISYYMRARFPVLRGESTCRADWTLRLR